MNEITIMTIVFTPRVLKYVRNTRQLKIVLNALSSKRATTNNIVRTLSEVE